jgi:hypothetical protein
VENRLSRDPCYALCASQGTAVQATTMAQLIGGQIGQ